MFLKLLPLKSSKTSKAIFALTLEDKRSDGCVAAGGERIPPQQSSQRGFVGNLYLYFVLVFCIFFKFVFLTHVLYLIIISYTLNVDLWEICICIFCWFFVFVFISYSCFAFNIHISFCTCVLYLCLYCSVSEEGFLKRIPLNEAVNFEERLLYRPQIHCKTCPTQ